MCIVRDGLAGAAVSLVAWIGYRATDGVPAASLLCVAAIVWVLTLAVTLVRIYEINQARPSMALRMGETPGGRRHKPPRCDWCRQRMTCVGGLWMCRRCDFVEPSGRDSSTDTTSTRWTGWQLPPD